MSNGRPPLSLSSAAKTSACISIALSVNLVNLRFSLIQFIAVTLFSTRTAISAPRLNASIAIPPLPENKSRKRAPYISLCNTLKSVSFVLSSVGRVSVPAGVLSGRLLRLPAMTLILFFSSHILIRCIF